ncbi:tetratricopeptide repeat protein [Helicobacter sp. L8]|uniref:tetratricopeptide repeat protein n=1 Tax=Helicobacter sp. L8 TaxID=2316078 RepID=UPI000EB1F0AD|nr:tetratricopeptide repeat protein [Helicobacter sp. L8]
MSVSFEKCVLSVVLLFAAALGVCYAGNQLAKSYDDSKDYGKSVSYWQKLIEMGDSRGYNEMGAMYEDGKGIVKDCSKALQYYQKAADMGDIMAYNNLGIMYENGEGVGQDKEVARQYYQKACDLGDQESCEYAKDLAPKHTAYKLNFDIQKKEFDLFGEGLGTLIEITSKNRDPVRLEGIIINEAILAMIGLRLWLMADQLGAIREAIF